MKMPDLKFKVFTLTEDRTLKICDALKSMGYSLGPINVNTCMLVNGLACITSSSLDDYYKSDLPEVTFEQALEMINMVESDCTNFDIKLFDKVLARDDYGDDWWFDFASGVVEDSQHIGLSGARWNQIIRFEGNEKLFNTNELPKQWWECNDDKPILVTSANIIGETVINSDSYILMSSEGNQNPSPDEVKVGDYRKIEKGVTINSIRNQLGFKLISDQIVEVTHTSYDDNTIFVIPVRERYDGIMDRIGLDEWVIEVGQTIDCPSCKEMSNEKINAIHAATILSS